METRISLERAIQLLLERFSPITDTVLLPLDEANGRILAQDVYSPIAQPPFPLERIQEMADMMGGEGRLP